MYEMKFIVSGKVSEVLMLWYLTLLCLIITMVYEKLTDYVFWEFSIFKVL